MENSEDNPAETKTILKVSKVEIKTYLIGAVCECGGDLVCTLTDEEWKELYSSARMNFLPSLCVDVPMTHTCRSCEKTIKLNNEFPRTVTERVGDITYAYRSI